MLDSSDELVRSIAAVSIVCFLFGAPLSENETDCRLRVVLVSERPPSFVMFNESCDPKFEIFGDEVFRKNLEVGPVGLLYLVNKARSRAKFADVSRTSRPVFQGRRFCLSQVFDSL